MPGGVSGRQVADQARVRREGIRILFASGCAPDALLRGRRLGYDERFLAKPYSADELVRSVHDACERREPS
jgi:CheY-like chemotaxis protein